MRRFGVLVVLAMIAVPRAAPADDLADGAALATQGRFKDAIAKFKAAHTGDPNRSEPMCMIALAYRRLERWGQAKLFLDRCLTFDTKPDWADEARTDIDAGIAHGGLAPVSFALDPGAAATVSVSSFSEDEVFSPQTISLEPGKQLITITAAGYKTQQLAVEIPSAAPYEVKVVLVPTPALTLTPGSVHQAASRPTSPFFTSKRVLIGSGIVLGVAVTLHVLASIERGDLTNDDGATYHAQLGTFQAERALAIAAYGAAAIGTAIGLWMLHSESSTQLAVLPQQHGAAVAWSHAW